MDLSDPSLTCKCPFVVVRLLLPSPVKVLFVLETSIDRSSQVSSALGERLNNEGETWWLSRRTCFAQ